MRSITSKYLLIGAASIVVMASARAKAAAAPATTPATPPVDPATPPVDYAALFGNVEGFDFGVELPASRAPGANTPRSPEADKIDNLPAPVAHPTKPGEMIRASFFVAAELPAADVTGDARTKAINANVRTLSSSLSAMCRRVHKATTKDGKIGKAFTVRNWTEKGVAGVRVFRVEDSKLIESNRKPAAPGTNAAPATTAPATTAGAPMPPPPVAAPAGAPIVPTAANPFG